MVIQKVNNTETVLASVTRFDGGFQMPLALVKNEWRFLPPGATQSISIPGQLERQWKAWGALQWAIKNYGTQFRLPSVEIFDGTAEEALQETIKVGGLGRGFGKLVFRRPWGSLNYVKC